jgi:hypothetical protein
VKRGPGLLGSAGFVFYLSPPSGRLFARSVWGHGCSASLAYASAQETCESKAVSKDGSALAGAKKSFMQKCEREA